MVMPIIPDRWCVGMPDKQSFLREVERAASDTPSNNSTPATTYVRGTIEATNSRTRAFGPTRGFIDLTKSNPWPIGLKLVVVLKFKTFPPI